MGGIIANQFSDNLRERCCHTLFRSLWKRRSLVPFEKPKLKKPISTAINYVYARACVHLLCKYPSYVPN